MYWCYLKNGIENRIIGVYISVHKGTAVDFHVNVLLKKYKRLKLD